MSECLNSIDAHKSALFTMHSKVKKHADYRQVLQTVVLMQLADSMVQQDWYFLIIYYYDTGTSTLVSFLHILHTLLTCIGRGYAADWCQTTDFL